MSDGIRAEAEDLLAEMAALVAEHGLTPTQERRATATLAGKTPSEIAADEHVSKQAVAKTVAAPKVRALLRDWIDAATETQTKNGVATTTSMIGAAMGNLFALMHAEKAVVHGGSFTMVADNEIRLRATLKVLEIYDPTQRAGASPPPVASEEPTVEESAVEETVTATRRVARRRRR